MLLALLFTASVTFTDTLVRSAPEEVGMSSSRLAEIERVLKIGVDAGAFPGAAVVVVRRGVVVWERGVGRLGWTAADPTVDPARSLYDLASVTKVMATALGVLVLHDAGELSIDDPISRHLPEFTGGSRDQVTIRQLLMHQGGLASGIALRAGEPVAANRQRVLASPVLTAPGGRAIYSDVGPMLLGLLIERVTNSPLQEFLEQRVYRPLHLRRTRFRPSGATLAQVAPSGSAIPRGAVHDGNARALGGVAGHAGLFSTARDVAVFAQMVLNGGSYGGVRILREATAREFVTRGSEARALGWSICHGGGSCGQRLGSSAFGHTGYSGASVWVDPERELIVVLLTNWVHRPPSATADPIAVLADVRADVADIAALAITDGPLPTIPLPAQLRADRAAGWYTPVGP